MKLVSREVIIDGEKPEITSRFPPRTVKQGEKVEVQVDANDSFGNKELSGVKLVEWSVAIDDQGNLKDKKPAQAISPGRYEFVGTDSLEPGKYRLYAQAADYKGNISDVVEIGTLTVEKPPEPPAVAATPAGERPGAGGGAAQTAPKKSSISGTVTFNKQPPLKATVTLKKKGLTDDKGETKDVGGNGAFRFDNLEPGEYQLSAEGVAKNVKRKWPPKDVKLEPPPARPPRVELSL
jgi:hypothetical protein